jgi:hypothetical protein
VRPIFHRANMCRLGLTFGLDDIAMSSQEATFPMKQRSFVSLRKVSSADPAFGLAHLLRKPVVGRRN